MTQEKYSNKGIKAFNFCSFSDLQKEVIALSHSWGWLGCLVRQGLNIVGFDMNVKEAWDKLKGKKCLFYNSSDGLIHDSAALYRAVQKQPKGKTTVVEMSPDPVVNVNAHNRHLFPDEANLFYEEILKMLRIDRKETALEDIQVTEETINNLIQECFNTKEMGSRTYPTKEFFAEHLRQISSRYFMPVQPARISVIG